MKRALILLSAFLVVSLSSCRKETYTKGIITVYNAEGIPVPGVMVTLSQNDMGPGVDQTNVVSVQTTDAYGQSEHVFEHEAIMNIDAVMMAEADTILSGKSVIRLVKGKSIYKDVEVVSHF
jgi:hypothetical protein